VDNPSVVAADVHARVGREADRDRVVHPALADGLVVDVQGHFPAGGGLGRVGGAGLIVAYPHSAAAKVEPAVTRALTKAVGEAEGHHVKALKGAIADAQRKMAETGG